MIFLSLVNLFIADGLATCLDACISHSSFPLDCAQYPTQKTSCEAVRQQCQKECAVVEVTAVEEQTIFSDVQVGIVEGAMKACPAEVKALARFQIPELRKCHVSSLEEFSGVTGRMIVEVDLDNGGVFRTQIKENRTADNALASCVQKQIKTWKLDLPCTDLVSITLEFQPMEASYANGDLDQDGVSNYVDLFPRDPNESVDTDGDGVGDNSDAFPNDVNETKDSDGDGIGDNAELRAQQLADEQQLSEELQDIDKDFQMQQELADERRAFERNAYKEINESLNGKEMIYKANSPLKQEWLNLIGKRIAMKESRNTRKMSKYLEEIDRVSKEIKEGHTLVVTDEKYAAIPEKDRSRVVYLFAAKEIDKEVFSIHKEVGARIKWWDSPSNELGFRLEGGTDIGLALHFNSGNKMARDYELFLGTKWLLPEATVFVPQAMVSVELVPRLIRTDILARVSSGLELEPAVGLAVRYETKSFWSVTGGYDYSFDGSIGMPAVSLGYKWIKKF